MISFDFHSFIVGNLTAGKTALDTVVLSPANGLAVARTHVALASAATAAHAGLVLAPARAAANERKAAAPAKAPAKAPAPAKV